MNTQLRRCLAVGLMVLTAGCLAEMPDETATSVEEIRCGRTTCALPNATATCHRGGCVIASCFTYRGDCNHRDADGCEVNISTDVRNCGGCGTVCPARAHAAKTCTQGACGFACRPGYTDCDGRAGNGCEVDTNGDNNNCGACGNRCWGTSQCCAGVCVERSYDVNHCGACGNICESGPNGSAACDAGTCALQCSWPYGNCDGAASNGCEVNHHEDATNCGACGNACPAGTTCQFGSCVCPTPGQQSCADPSSGERRCIDLQSDPNNCGDCGRVCAGGTICWYGNCQCPAGQLSCPDPSTGAERCINVVSDPNNCGACGYVCPEGRACQSAQCVCTADQTQCWNPYTGHFDCTSSATDVNNCGGCGVQCAAGTTCADGRCVAACTTCGDRCVDTAIDPANCGACGNACPAGEFCSAGACAALSQSTSYVRTTPPAGVSFVDACRGATGLLPSTANASTSVGLPFDLWFWGTSIPSGSVVNVSTDGFINLDGWAAVRTSTIPDTSRPNSVIAAFAGGYYGTGGGWITTGPSGICSATFGTAPDRRFVVEWKDAQSPYPGMLSTEIILYESTGAIDILTEAHTAPPGGIAIVGVESPDGTRAVSGCADASALCQTPTGYRARFVPAP